MPRFDSQTIQLVIIGIAALAVVMQAFVLIAILFALKKAATSIHKDVQELRTTLTPLLHETRDFIARVAPQIESTTNDVAEMAHTWREKTTELDLAVTEIVARAQQQTSRVDGMVTSVLDSAERVGEFVSDRVSKPVRHISALVAAARAVVQSLSETAPRSHASSGSVDQGPSA
jgi:methyl-accepting chemotaxis protein